MNPYFDLEKPRVVESIEELLSLNMTRRYYAPGNETPPPGDPIFHAFPYSTSGMFRGQLRDWPLIPKSFRDLDIKTGKDSPRYVRHEYRKATGQFHDFCGRAEIQNPGFPSHVSDRMSIAQHFGVKTPLLDWSQNVIIAAFFAVRDVFAAPEFEDDMRVFIYHLIDERYLHQGIPEEPKLHTFDQSAYIKPYHIDRRIERQRGVFSFHPHPGLSPSKIPVNVYVLEFDILFKLRDMLEGFGWTGDYFFPDYAGIAHAVKSEMSL